MASFTKGPWEQSHREGADWNYRTQVYPANDPDNPIATLHWHEVPTETGFRTDREENARLIAAAPDLYDVVFELLGANKDDTWDTDRRWLVSAAEKAIAKAEGKDA